MSSAQIRIQINLCNAQIAQNRRKIRKKEAAYNSLTTYKESVVNYQTSFGAGNDAKNKALDAVWEIKKECLTADRYYTGMKGIVPVVGGKIVGYILEKLIDSSKDKMKKYVNEIGDIEDENDRLEKKIKRLERELKLAEMEESIANANR